MVMEINGLCYRLVLYTNSLVCLNLIFLQSWCRAGNVLTDSLWFWWNQRNFVNNIGRKKQKQAENLLHVLGDNIDRMPPSPVPMSTMKNQVQNISEFWERKKQSSGTKYKLIREKVSLKKSYRRAWEYINRSQIHERGNWKEGCAVSFLGIFV
jgi:hypothetical protein